ncbi:MAG: response regulator [Lachnospiraceae bacterium]|nr:response regulator [Lachnospiraceae bacterium]
MYTILLTLQIIAIVFCLVSAAVLIIQKGSEVTKLIMVGCFCAFIQNAGYYLEMTSKNLDEVMIALKLEYIGTAFIATMSMLFVFRYCRVTVLRWLKILMLAVDVLVLASVWCYEYVPFYYKNVEFVDTGVFPHVVLTKGFLYIIFMVTIYAELVGGLVVASVFALRTSDPNMKVNYRLLLISNAVPLIFYIAGVCNMIDGYDPAPLGGAVGILIFCANLIFRRVFDVVETAHENILTDLEDAIVVLDYRRGFQEANRAAINLFPELARTAFGELVPNEQFYELFDNKDNNEVEIDGRFYNVHINELYARSGLQSNFIGYSIIFFDITDARQQIKKMDELRIAADAANKAKSDFLANVSHEIRTPINVVQGMSEVIMRDYDDPKLLEYASNIQNSADQLLDLINGILDFSKIESGKVTLSNVEYRVDEFFSDIIMVFEHKGDEKNLKFITDIAGNIPAILYGDALRIRQVATNILSNAFKYTREGSVTLRARFEKITEEKGNLIFSVEDTGIGIKKDEIDKMFELFVRLDERLNRSVEGTGLGMNITKRLIDLMGGEIKVYSEYGKGSVFTVIIPQFIRSKAGENIGEIRKRGVVRAHVGLGFECPDARVLVIDDSKTNLIVAKALLRDTKADIVTGTSGDECLDFVGREHFDVIFLDHRMPGMDGVETLRKMQMINHKCQDTPVIMLTANAVNDAREFYLRQGFADFIAKPITEQSICRMLLKYLPPELVIKTENMEENTADGKEV